MLRNALAVVAATAFVSLGVVAAAMATDSPGNGGKDPCSHGNANKPCKEDPNPDKGKDCEEHGNSGGKNEDHCSPGETTPTTPTTTIPTTTTPTTPTPTTPTTTTPTTTEPSVTTTGSTPVCPKPETVVIRTSSTVVKWKTKWKTKTVVKWRTRYVVRTRTIVKIKKVYVPGLRKNGVEAKG